MQKKQEIRLKILRTLSEQGTVTRPALIRETGIRTATILKIVDELKTEGILAEPDRPCGKTGRKAPVITFAPDCFWTAGVDFQTKGTIGVVSDMTGKIRYQYKCSAGSRRTLDECHDEIRSVLKELFCLAGENCRKIRGIGFADPGLVDVEKSFSIRAVNIPPWKNTATGQWIEQEFHVSGGVWPECSIRTFMEYRQRIASRPRSLLLLKLAHGIGAGFIKNGICFSGDTHQAMEIGHIVVDPRGPLCRCGNRGCLEAIAGEDGIRRRVLELIADGVETSLTAESFSLERFVTCARTEKTARMIALNVSENIGCSLAAAVSLLNPSVIVLSGVLTGLGELLTEPVERILNLRCFPGTVKDLKIEISNLKPEDTAYGAALLIREKLLQADVEHCDAVSRNLKLPRK